MLSTLVFIVGCMLLVRVKVVEYALHVYAYSLSDYMFKSIGTSLSRPFSLDNLLVLLTAGILRLPTQSPNFRKELDSIQ